MSVAYDKIDKDLKKSRKDVMFPSSLLDELDENERKDVENRVVSLCLDGETACVKYLGYLKYVVSKDIFTLENLSKLPVEKQCSILKFLFSNTNDVEYLNRLLKIATIYIEAYSELVFMYLNGEYSNSIKARIFEILKQFSTKNPTYYHVFKVIDTDKTIDQNIKFTDLEQKKQQKSVDVTLKTITGKELTADDIAAMVAYKKNSEKKTFVDEFDDYYEKDGVIIKFVSSKEKAYILSNGFWVYSKEDTEKLKANKEYYPRRYNYYENFPYKKEETATDLLNSPGNCKYMKLSDNRTAKVDLDEHKFYVLNEESKFWKEIPSLYTDYCYGNVICSEIEFNDEYPIEEKKKSK